MSYTAGLWAEIRAMTDEEVVAQFDLRGPDTVVGLNFWTEELARRSQARINHEMLRLTRTIHRLTWVMASLTVISAVCAGVSVYLAASYQ